MVVVVLCVDVVVLSAVVDDSAGDVVVGSLVAYVLVSVLEVVVGVGVLVEDELGSVVVVVVGGDGRPGTPGGPVGSLGGVPVGEVPDGVVLPCPGVVLDAAPPSVTGAVVASDSGAATA